MTSCQNCINPYHLPFCRLLSRPLQTLACSWHWQSLSIIFQRWQLSSIQSTTPLASQLSIRIACEWRNSVSRFNLAIAWNLINLWASELVATELPIDWIISPRCILLLVRFAARRNFSSLRLIIVRCNLQLLYTWQGAIIAAPILAATGSKAKALCASLASVFRYYSLSAKLAQPRGDLQLVACALVARSEHLIEE